MSAPILESLSTSLSKSHSTEKHQLLAQITAVYGRSAVAGAGFGFGTGSIGIGIGSMIVTMALLSIAQKL